MKHKNPSNSNPSARCQKLNSIPFCKWTSCSKRPFPKKWDLGHQMLINILVHLLFSKVKWCYLALSFSIEITCHKIHPSIHLQGNEFLCSFCTRQATVKQPVARVLLPEEMETKMERAKETGKWVKIEKKPATFEKMFKNVEEQTFWTWRITCTADITTEFTKVVCHTCNVVSSQGNWQADFHQWFQSTFYSWYSMVIHSKFF